MLSPVATDQWSRIKQKPNRNESFDKVASLPFPIFYSLIHSIFVTVAEWTVHRHQSSCYCALYSVLRNTKLCHAGRKEHIGNFIQWMSKAAMFDEANFQRNMCGEQLLSIVLLMFLLCFSVLVSDVSAHPKYLIMKNTNWFNCNVSFICYYLLLRTASEPEHAQKIAKICINRQTFPIMRRNRKYWLALAGLFLTT